LSTIAEKIASAGQFREASQRVSDFLAIARALASSRTEGEAARMLRQRPNADRLLEQFEQRAAVSPATTTDATWGEPLSQFQLSATAFAESLRR
jgi:hypothetical protein